MRQQSLHGKLPLQSPGWRAVTLPQRGENLTSSQTPELLHHGQGLRRNAGSFCFSFSSTFQNQEQTKGNLHPGFAQKSFHQPSSAPRVPHDTTCHVQQSSG